MKLERNLHFYSFIVFIHHNFFIEKRKDFSLVTRESGL